MSAFVNIVKENLVSCLSVIASILGLLLEIVGAFAFCQATGVGMNMSVFSNGMVITGLVFVAASLVASIEEIVRTKVNKTDTTAAILALETACTVVLVSALFLIAFSAWDLIVNL